MNKVILIKKIVSRLKEDLEVYYRAAHASHAEATHEQNKAESKYDTRGLEASYLARGQSRQAAQMEEAIVAYERLGAGARKFSELDAVDMGALVELEHESERMLCFIGPKAGGTEVVVGRREATVVTPESPLGRQLMGKRQGDSLTLSLGGTPIKHRIVQVT